MSLSLSWIDPAALAASLARAGVGSATPRSTPSAASGNPAVPQPLGNGAFAASSPPPPVSRPVQAEPTVSAASPSTQAVQAEGALRPTVEPTTVAAAAASRAAATQQGTAEVEMELFEPPAKRLHARLEAFMDWVERHVNCHEIFIVDEEGLVLMEKNSDPTLIAVSSYFLNFNDRIRSSLGAQSEGSIAIDLEGGQTLHVVQADTRLGAHALGFTISQPLRRSVTEGFRSTLPVVFEQ